MEMEVEEVQLQGVQIVKISDGESDDEAGMEDCEDESHMVMFEAGLQGMGQRD